MDANDFHKVGLTFEFLDDFLKTAGFTSVQKIAEFGLFDDDSNLQIGGSFISLNVIAVK